MLLDFRARVMQARRGIWTFQIAKLKLKHTFTFFGMQISNGLMTFTLISFILFPVIILLAWSLTWDVLIWFLENHYTWLIVFIMPIIVNSVLKFVFTRYIGPKQVIKHRMMWMFYDIYELMLSCLTGITKALVRFVLVIFSTLFSLPRMDVSIFPAWLDYYVALDTGARSYHALILSYHMHNNPLLRCVCWMLQEDAAKRRAGIDPSFCSPGYRKVASRFRKLWMLYKMPKLRSYSATGQQIPLEVVRKAAKKKDPEILRRELSRLSSSESMPEVSIKKGLFRTGKVVPVSSTKCPPASPPPSPPQQQFAELMAVLDAAGLTHRAELFGTEAYGLEQARLALRLGDQALMADLRELGLPVGECRVLAAALAAQEE